jgi:iron complex transport system permease protein
VSPRGRHLALAILAAAFLAVLTVVPLVGDTVWSWSDVASTDAMSRLVLLRIRLPRVLLGLAAGGSLAIAGLALQTLFRNPLAEPYTLGVASGASLGAVLALQVGASSTLGLPIVGLAAFAGALAVTLILLGLASTRFGDESAGMLLAGVAISLSCSAAILFIQYLADWTKTFRMVRWMMGGLAVVGYTEVLWLVVPLALGLTLLMLRRWELDLLLAGEELAASRGVDLRRLRLVVLGTVSLLVGAVVAVAGPIGFVGLIVPHLLRRWVGHGHLQLVPASFLGGAVFLALCDLAARRVMYPAELPVGVVTALLGGPFFLWVLLSRRRAA